MLMASLSTRIDPAAHSLASARLTKACPVCQARYPEDFRVCPRDASELENIPEAEGDAFVGTIIGDTFEIKQLIGEGGMARVYEARHLRLPTRRFAVKVLHAEYAQQPGIVARFQREAEAASGIGHPNVVDVFDVGYAADGTPYLVSELLDGRDFAALLDEQGRIEPPAAVHIVRQVCRALAAAHDAGVVHRDVKPENVFLVGDPLAPIVKVIDFGISKFDPGGAGGATLTQTGMIMGTPGYMPPEQARGAKTDHRADIYGVGAMLYRAVTGKLPFDSDDPGQVLGMVLTVEPPRPRSLAPNLPEALELVIQKAMAKDPADRYATMHDVDDALAPFDPEMSVSLSLLPPMPGSGPHRSVAGPTVISGQATTRTRTRSNADLAGREAKQARPTLVWLSLVAYPWAVGCIVEIASACFRLGFRGGRPLTGSERTAVLVTVLALSLTPLVFWVRRVVGTWTNSMRAVELAGMLRRLVLWAIFPYAALALAVRLVDAGPEWALGVFAPPVASLLGAVGAYVLARWRARRERAST
jgi:serine/threonine protein kinase